MAVNTSAHYQGAVARKLERQTLEVAQRFLVVSQFADKKTLDKRSGTSWTATRFNRLPLPYSPLSEGVPPIGETLTISQVTGVALQWGDKITFTDVAQTTIQYDLLDKASDRLGMQIAETKERNCFNILMGGTQVNYVNTRGARASLVAGDVLDPATVNRTVANLKLLGAPLYNGQTGETVNRSLDRNVSQSEMGPKAAEHYVSVGNTLVFNDFAANATVVQAWSFSDVTRLYINEAGYWRGMHFCESNMIPSFTGVAAVTGTAGTAGALATADYYVQVTGSDTQNQYKSRIYQASGAISVTGATGSISVTTPATTGFTYSIYVGLTASPQNLGLTASGPSSGPYTGQATQLPPGTAVVITGTGLFQVPPAAPATGVTVYPTFVFGKGAFAGLKLEEVSWTRLFEADKGDPLNQLRVIGYKFFEGWVILNQQFMARIEFDGLDDWRIRLRRIALMAYMVRVTAEYCWVPAGAAGAMLGQAQADNPGYGAAAGPGEVGMAQSLTMRVAEPVAAAAANTDFQAALAAAAADLYTRFTTAGSEPGYTPGTPFALVTAWATGSP